ncbi:HNH endonuclease [Microtetraspora fusca]|uniref:HNH endonuclease n=1 Tax=Microtetraspora fusca TaxID=1997 RepID=A0ABW6VML4_MICFU
MPWKEASSSWRTTPRPTGWKTIRAACLKRDGHQCTWLLDDGVRCTQPGTDADHIGDPTDHRLDNLRTLCTHHHRKRTALQAVAARRPRPTRARPRDRHPGLTD